jgi:hypothetical protein
MELSRYELAAVKKTAQIIKPKRAKICKLLAKREEINRQIDSLQSEIDLWEAPIITKHGYSSEQILSGEADEIASQTENMSEVPVETVDDTEEGEAADMRAGHTSTSVDENPEL